MVTAVGVLLRRRSFWYLGWFAVVAFVIDRLINGYVLYEKPGAGGTSVNVLAATLICLALWLGKLGLEKS
jgi:hypothetical protein